MSSFSSGRFAVCKNTTDNKLKENRFLRLKILVHVEPVWFSLDNLTLCAALTTTQWLCTRLKKIWDELKLFSYERDDFFFIVFFEYRDKLSAKQKKSSDKPEIPCGTKLLRVLIFTIFAIFPAIRKNNFPPQKLTKTFFPQKFTPGY